MKKTLILLTGFFILISACKKKSSCGDTICRDNEECINGECHYCGPNKHFENGACVCDSGWFGWDCERDCSECGTHGQCVENWCSCDTGWIGGNCSCAIDSFIGTYQVSGTYSSWVGGSASTGNFTSTVTVEKNGNKLVFKGQEHDYEPISDTLSVCSFLWYATSNVNSEMSFRRQFDDSIFYYKEVISPGGGNIESGRGKKIN